MAQLIPNADLTSGLTTGVGTFDLLMRSVLAHIEKEYQAGRIKGNEYSQVYLGAMTAVMQNATQFLVSQLNADKNAALIDAQIAKTAKEEALIDAQILKITAEIAVLEQRKFTEEAQILDTVNGSTVAGVLGKQKSLYAAQTDGFTRDAEQKLTKMMIDVWSVQRTTDEAISPAGAGITDSEIKKVVDKAKIGIGVTPA